MPPTPPAADTPALTQHWRTVRLQGTKVLLSWPQARTIILGHPNGAPWVFKGDGAQSSP